MSTKLELWRDLEAITARAERHYEPLPYHCFEHALDTLREVNEISHWYEEQGHALKQAEIEDAQIGALYHDAGFHVPVHVHGLRSKEKYSAQLMRQDQEELGMPKHRISRIGNAILATELHVPPKTRVGKLLRQADLSNVAKGSPIAIIKKSIQLFREDEILKRDYDHPGEIKKDLVSFVVSSFRVMEEYNKDDVAMGDFDYDPNGRSHFANLLARGQQCFVPEQAKKILRQIKALPPEDD